MGKIKNAAKTLGEIADAWADNNRKVEDMTDLLMKRTYGVERDQDRKIAAVLVHQAEITWK